MSLKDKLRKIAAEGQRTETDWNIIRDIWLKQVEKLYREIENWFGEYFDEGYMRISFREITLSEEHIGLYQINVMELDIGGPLVVMEPVGRNILGTAGRIDLYMSGHRADRIMLLLMSDSKGQPFWELRKRNIRTEKYLFEHGIFEELIEGWLELYSIRQEP